MTQDAVQGKLDALETKIGRTIDDAVEAHTATHHGDDGSDSDADLEERVAVVESALKTHAVVGSFKASLKENLPRVLAGDSIADGWSYLWNPKGPVGTASNYAPLKASDPVTPVNRPNFRPNPGNSWPDKAAGTSWLHITMDGFGHPGSRMDPDDPDSETCFIAGWLAAEEDVYAVMNSELGIAEPDARHMLLGNGLRLSVLVDDDLKCVKDTRGEQLKRVDFNCLLGTVAAGSTIYVAVCGGGSSNSYDTFSLDFSIGRGLQTAIEAASEYKASRADVVDAVIGRDVAGFKADFPEKNGFSYHYNVGPITDPTSYKKMGGYTQENVREYNCPGVNQRPATTTNCKAKHAWTLVGSGVIHPGSQDSDIKGYAVVRYTVAEQGIYGITNSFVKHSAGDEGFFNSDGIEVVVYVQPRSDGEYATDMAKVFDSHVISSTRDGGQKHVIPASFDTVLGVLGRGANIYVCVGPGPRGLDGWDYYEMDFTISTGPVPLMLPSLVEGTRRSIPLLGGAGPVSGTVLAWRGSAKAGEWNTVLAGSKTDPMLSDGTYFFVTDPADVTGVAGQGGWWEVQVTSSIFTWKNTGTNDNDEHNIPVSLAGHATNGEEIHFRTLLVPRSNRQRAQLQFSTSVNWPKTVNLRFTFVRLL